MCVLVSGGAIKLPIAQKDHLPGGFGNQRAKLIGQINMGFFAQMAFFAVNNGENQPLLMMSSTLKVLSSLRFVILIFQQEGFQ
jgi:hypothetical protein